jgi:hypothetical protein
MFEIARIQAVSLGVDPLYMSASIRGLAGQVAVGKKALPGLCSICMVW